MPSGPPSSGRKGEDSKAGDAENDLGPGVLYADARVGAIW